MTEIYQSQEFSVEYENLKRRKAEGQGEAEYLFKIIGKGIEKLKQNHEAGQKIPRQMWPKYYVQKYGVNNLWRLQLDDFWRMIYTLTKEEKVELVAVILEVMDHNDYNKRFGYK